MRLLFESDLRPFEAAAARTARPGTLSLLVDLQLPCNLRCAGCPGRGRGIPLSEEAASGLLDAVLARSAEQGARALDLVVFGGEPLLDADHVLALSTGASRACRAAGIAYRGHLITNGTLLDLLSPRDVIRSGLRRMQVTLDGPAAVHDRRRPMLDGSGSWQRIVDGMARLRGVVQLVVRVTARGLSPEVEALVAALGDTGLLGPGPGAAAIYVAPEVGYPQQARDLLRLFPLLAGETAGAAAFVN